VGGRIINGRPGRFGDLDLYLNHSEWISGTGRSCTTFPTMAVVYRRDAIGPARFPETNYGEDTFFAHAVRARGGRIWFDPAFGSFTCTNGSTRARSGRGRSMPDDSFISLDAR
jgi:hypothetical protein